MARFIETGKEFLFSHLHGIWGDCFHGARLENLINSTTEEILLRNLQLEENAAGGDLVKIIEERQCRYLEDIEDRLYGPFAEFYHLILFGKALDNLFAILDYRYFPEMQSGSMSDALIRIRQFGSIDFEAALHCQEIEQFIRLINFEKSPEISQVVRELDKDRDIMKAECALDKFYLCRLLQCANKLPGKTGNKITALVQKEIDISNAMMLLRNFDTYHLPAERLAFCWVDGGNMSHRDFEKMVKVSSLLELINLLPPYMRRDIMENDDKISLSKVENRWWGRIYHDSLKLFYDFNDPQSGILAFPYLLRTETWNLCRVYEGIRFSLPPRIIRDLLVDSGKENNSQIA